MNLAAEQTPTPRLLVDAFNLVLEDEAQGLWPELPPQNRFTCSAHMRGAVLAVGITTSRRGHRD